MHQDRVTVVSYDASSGPSLLAIDSPVKSSTADDSSREAPPRSSSVPKKISSWRTKGKKLIHTPLDFTMPAMDHFSIANRSLELPIQLSVDRPVHYDQYPYDHYLHNTIRTCVPKYPLKSARNASKTIHPVAPIRKYSPKDSRDSEATVSDGIFVDFANFLTETSFPQQNDFVLEAAVPATPPKSTPENQGASQKMALECPIEMTRSTFLEAEKVASNLSQAPGSSTRSHLELLIQESSSTDSLNWHKDVQRQRKLNTASPVIISVIENRLEHNQEEKSTSTIASSAAVTVHKNSIRPAVVRVQHDGEMVSASQQMAGRLESGDLDWV